MERGSSMERMEVDTQGASKMSPVTSSDASMQPVTYAGPLQFKHGSTSELEVDYYPHVTQGIHNKTQKTLPLPPDGPILKSMGFSWDYLQVIRWVSPMNSKKSLTMRTVVSKMIHYHLEQHVRRSGLVASKMHSFIMERVLKHCEFTFERYIGSVQDFALPFKAPRVSTRNVSHDYLQVLTGDKFGFSGDEDGHNINGFFPLSDTEFNGGYSQIEGGTIVESNAKKDMTTRTAGTQDRYVNILGNHCKALFMSDPYDTTRGWGSTVYDIDADADAPANVVLPSAVESRAEEYEAYRKGVSNPNFDAIHYEYVNKIKPSRAPANKKAVKATLSKLSHANPATQFNVYSIVEDFAMPGSALVCCLNTTSTVKISPKGDLHTLVLRGAKHIECDAQGIPVSFNGFNKYTKQALIRLCSEQNIPTNSQMTKPTLIGKITAWIDKVNKDTDIVNLAFSTPAIEHVLSLVSDSLRKFMGTPKEEVTLLSELAVADSSDMPYYSKLKGELYGMLLLNVSKELDSVAKELDSDSVIFARYLNDTQSDLLYQRVYPTTAGYSSKHRGAARRRSRRKSKDTSSKRHRSKRHRSKSRTR